MSDTPTPNEWRRRSSGSDNCRVREDPILEPVFRGMDRDYPRYVRVWLGEVFGGWRATRTSAAAIRT